MSAPRKKPTPKPRRKKKTPAAKSGKKKLSARRRRKPQKILTEKPADRRRADPNEREYQLSICVGLALFKTDRQIKDDLMDHYNISLSTQTINEVYRHGKKWAPIIRYLRKRYLRQISHIPIAKKAYRLAMLQDAAREAMTWHTKTINEHGVVMEKKLGVLAQIVREARAEVEGEKPSGPTTIDKSKHYYLTKVDLSKLPPNQLIDVMLGRYDPTNDPDTVLGRKDGDRLSQVTT